MTLKVIIVNFLILNMGSGIVEFIVKIVSLTSKIAINGSRGLKRKFQWLPEERNSSISPIQDWAPVAIRGTNR